MKKAKIISIITLISLSLTIKAQTVDNKQNTQSSTLNTEVNPFKAHLVNDEFQVWLDIDFIKTASKYLVKRY